MRNKKILLNIFITFLLLLSVSVEASTCTAEEEKNLKNEANAIEINPILDDEYNPYHEYYYSVNISNFSNKFYIMDSEDKVYRYYDEHTSNSLYGLYSPGKTIVFRIYGAPNKTCEYVLLKTIRINLDYYNDYSTYPECEGIEDFALCQRNYSGKIRSDEWFYKKLEEYKNGTVDEELIIEPEDKKTSEKIQIFIKENIFLILIIVIVLLLITIFIIIKTKKNHKIIKIKFE